MNTQTAVRTMHEMNFRIWATKREVISGMVLSAGVFKCPKTK